MKRLLRFTILIVLMAACVLAVALSSCKKESYTYGLRYEIDERTGGYRVEDIGSAYAAKIIIPAQYEGLPVTSIGVAAFENCDFIKEVVIPDSVISIGHDAFYGTAFYRDSGNWENDALYVGKNLIEVKELVGDNRYKTGNFAVREGTVNIADCAFYNCKGLTGITLPEGVKTIGRYAFFGCEKIENLTIPQSVKSIDNYALQNCTALVEADVPDGVTRLGDGVFWGCKKLARCSIGSGVGEISYYSFNNCSALAQVSIPQSVTKIGDLAFNNCKGLERVTIPQGVISVGTQAFFGCTGLKEAVFERTGGWAVSRSPGFAESIDIASSELSSPSVAAGYLTGQYNAYFWKRA